MGNEWTAKAMAKTDEDVSSLLLLCLHLCLCGLLWSSVVSLASCGLVVICCVFVVISHTGPNGEQ